MRWNEDRARAAVEGAKRKTVRSYNARLQHCYHKLTQKFKTMMQVENYTQPREYTGSGLENTPIAHQSHLE